MYVHVKGWTKLQINVQNQCYLCPMLKIGQHRLVYLNAHLDVCSCKCIWGWL